MMKFLRAALLGLFLLPAPAVADQTTGCIPTSSISGLTLLNQLNSIIKSITTTYSGASNPVTDCSSATLTGQQYLDTSTTPSTWRMWNGNQGLAIGVLDSTNHVWTPPVGGGTNTLASASTVDLGSVPQAYVSITGTATITSFGSTAKIGIRKYVSFASALVLTYNATSMILPTAGSITTTAGDKAEFIHTGSGNWAALSYTRADGSSLYSAAIPVGTVSFVAGFNAPDGNVFGAGQAISRTTYATYLAAVTNVQSATRTSGNATLTGFSETIQFRVGMNVEGAGIPAGATIASFTSTTVTLSANASSSGTSNVTVFAHGNGDGNTTVNVPDCQGRAMAGRDNMDGTARNRLTATYFGGNASGLGATGGVESRALVAGNLPAHTHNFSGTTGTENQAHSHSLTLPQSNNQGGATNFFLGQSDGGVPSPSGNVESAAHNHNYSGTTDGGNGLSATAFATVGPTLVLNCVVRVL